MRGTPGRLGTVGNLPHPDRLPNSRAAGSFSNPQTGWPCQAPPRGELTAVNYNTGEIAWRIPFGRVDESEAKGVMNTVAFTLP